MDRGVTVEYRICVPIVEGFHRPNGLVISTYAVIV
jgi:hypothetical protein